MTAGQRSRLRLPPQPQSAPAARSFARATLRGWRSPAELVDCVVLLVSELVANAVQHAGTRVTLEIERRDATTVRVVVEDDNDRPPRRRPVDLYAEGGRGLELVDALASRWGVDGRPRGKSVWFEVGAEAGSQL